MGYTCNFMEYASEEPIPIEDIALAQLRQL